MEIEPLGGLRAPFVLDFPPGPGYRQCCLGVHMATKGSLVHLEHASIHACEVGSREIGGSRPHEPPGLSCWWQLDQVQRFLQGQRGFIVRSHGDGCRERKCVGASQSGLNQTDDAPGCALTPRPEVLSVSRFQVCHLGNWIAPDLGLGSTASD